MAKDKKVPKVEDNQGNFTRNRSESSSPFPTVDFLSKLPSCVVWQLLTYLDTNSVVALAGVNTTLRQLVTARYNLTMSLPFNSTLANILKNNPYYHNKQVLRLMISNLRPDISKQDKAAKSPTVQQLPLSKQLLLLNLSHLSTLCINLEPYESQETSGYRFAFIGLLQSTGVFKTLTKLHLMMGQSLLHSFLPGNFGPYFMKDALCVAKLSITLTGGNKTNKENEIAIEEYYKGLENFFSMIKSKKFALSICSESSNKKILKVLNNDYVEYFDLVAPCNFQALLKMSRLRVLNMRTTGKNCPVQPTSHWLGKCVLDWKMVKEDCPKLKRFGRIKLEKFKELRAKKKKAKEYIKKVKARTVNVGVNKRRLRCGECEGCKKPNCGKCKNCKDMKMFGGKNTLRQACVGRKCWGKLLVHGSKGKCEKNSESGFDKEFPTVPVVKWTKFMPCINKFY